MNSIKPIVMGFCWLCIVMGLRHQWRGISPRDQQDAIKFYIMAIVLRVMIL